jgi:hypothetical protein
VSGQSAGDAAFATTLAKGLVVLEAFEDGASVLGKMELSARAGIPRPAVRLLVGGRGDGTRNCARAWRPGSGSSPGRVQDKPTAEQRRYSDIEDRFWREAVIRRNVAAGSARFRASL